MAKVTVELKGKIEIDCQGWSDDTLLSQVKAQAKREVEHWQFFVKKGSQNAEPVNFIRADVTEVTLNI